MCEELVDESPVMGGRVYDLCERKDPDGEAYRGRRG